ncbi:MAG: glycyl-radical enzyme activating protein [Pirellulales bacterium]|nr:glycyl-radical enzyme activating protein [Pirellulales bacterium]
MGPDDVVLVTDIQRFSINDGPGIRTTIFFKGCPLACRWCQNPETISFQNELIYSSEECLLCGDCVKACPQQNIRIDGNSIAIDHSNCNTCFDCARACPSRALAPAAIPHTCESLLKEVLRDVNYYGKKGGITLSGGEPLVHGLFLKKFLPKARKADLHIAAETAGHVQTEELVELADMIDLFLYDLKIMDSTHHKILTGKSNEIIIDNLTTLARKGCRIQPRMPLIPGFNDREKNLAETAHFLTSIGLTTITLLPYNNLGETKRAKIRCLLIPIESMPPTKEKIRAASDLFISMGLEVHIEI